MNIKSLFRGNLEFLNKALDLRAERQNLIASNVANNDTPGYKSLDISFEDQMKKVLDSNLDSKMNRTNGTHYGEGFSELESINPKVVKDQSPGRIDGNNVNIDKEMTKMSSNAIIYNAVANIVAKEFEFTKYVIEQGGK